MAELNPDEATEAAATPATGKSKLPVIIAVCVLFSALAGGGAYWFFGKDDSQASADAKDGANENGKDKAPKAPAIYVEFDPPFVVNFESKGMTRFLQITVQIMTRDQVTADLVKQHDPVIRNDLLMLFSNQTHDVIGTREGKELLRTQALEVVAEVIKAEGGASKNVEQLYFTSFVMQ